MADKKTDLTEQVEHSADLTLELLQEAILLSRAMEQRLSRLEHLLRSERSDDDHSD